MNKIDSFRGQYDFLSNMYPCNVKYKGTVFSCAETAYQYHKLIPCKQTLGFWKLDGKEARRLGRTLKMKPNWDHQKLIIMKEIVNAKFTQNPELMIKLLDTKDMYLEEGNQWGDTYWGTVNGKGTNNLGEILMFVRNLNKDNYDLYIKELKLKEFNSNYEKINLERIEGYEIPLENLIYNRKYNNIIEVEYNYPQINVEEFTPELVRTSKQLYVIMNNNTNNKVLVIKLRPYSVDDLIDIYLDLIKYKNKGVNIVTPKGVNCLNIMNKILHWVCPTHQIKIKGVYKDIKTRDGRIITVLNRKAMKARIFALNNIIMTNPNKESYEMYAYEDRSTLYRDEYRLQPYINKDNFKKEVMPYYTEVYYRNIPNKEYTIITKIPEWVQTKYWKENKILVPPLKHYSKCDVMYIGKDPICNRNTYLEKELELDSTTLYLCKLVGINPEDYKNIEYDDEISSECDGSVLSYVLNYMLNDLDNFIDGKLSLNQIKEIYDNIDNINNIKEDIKEAIIKRYNSGLYPEDPEICCTFNVKTEKSDYSNVIDDEYNLYIENIGYNDDRVDSEEEEDEE